MAVTHSVAMRNAIADLVDSTIGASGKLVFRLSGTVAAPGTAVATLTLDATSAFDAAGAAGGNADGVMTANAITSDTNATGNASPIATATLQTSADTVVVHCAVGTSGSDINIGGSGLTVAAGATVSCSSLTYTAPA